MNNVDILNAMNKSSEALSQNIQQCSLENTDLFSEMLLYLDILDIWSRNTQEHPCNAVLKEVCYDMLSSIYISSHGMYRNAYISLRSALELGLSFIYFVDNNYEYLLWKNNDYDMKWATLKDENNGVVSKRYLSLFFSNLDVSDLLEATQNTYRECSEYVHGKYEYMHTINEEKIFYNKQKFEQWAEMFLRVVKILNSFLAIRFNEKTKYFNEDKKITLLEIVNEFGLKGVIQND